MPLWLANREAPIDRVHIAGVVAFSTGGFILPHHLPRPNGQSSILPIELLCVMIVISYNLSLPEMERRITISIDQHRIKIVTKSMMHRLIEIHFSLIQILVPTIESEWGAEDGYLLVCDLGDQLRQVMRELESLDA